MSKYLKYFFLLALAVMLAGCIPTATPTPAPVEQNPTQLPVVDTPAGPPQVIYITATPFSPSGTEAAATATPVEAVATVTPTPSDTSLAIAGVDDLGGGRAVIRWSATGSFPTGYIVVYSDSNQNPTFPMNNYNYTGDPNARSAMITVEVGRIYYVRVCRYTNNTCDVYSNLGVFALQNVAPTSYASYPNGNYSPTAVPSSIAYNSNGDVISSSSTMAITSMTAAATGKAIIRWTATGTFSKGFAIVFSPSYTKPFIGGYAYYVVGDSTARSAYVDGTPGTTIYYRLCRYTGTTCDIYSAPFTYTFPGTAPTAIPVTATPVTPTPVTPTPVTPTPVTPTAEPTADTATLTLVSVSNTATLGSALATWSGTGDFSEGFKIVYSKTIAEPTDSGPNAGLVKSVVSSSAPYAAPFTGEAGETYHVRVCKVVSGACTIYSNAKDILFTADTATLVLNSITNSTLGSATVAWTATGSFPDGILILYSQTAAAPEMDATTVAVPDASTGTAEITHGELGATYHVRLCKYVGSTCLFYSNAQDITFATDPATISLDSVVDSTDDTATVSWTPSSDFADGYRLLVSTTHDPADLGSEINQTISEPTTHTASFAATAGTTYHVRVCKIYDTNSCSSYSNQIDFTKAQLVLNSVTDLTNVSLTDPTVGQATVSWTPQAGTFDGFLVVYSSTITLPTEADSPVSAGSTDTSATIEGTAGTQYYVRVCKYNGSACVAYSNAIPFTFAKITLGSFTVSTTDEAEGTLNWTAWAAPDSFPYGFLYLFSISNDTPVYTDTTTTSYGSVSGGGTQTSAIFHNLIPGGQYYLRICQATASATCLVYSDVKMVNLPSSLVLQAAAGTVSGVDLTWSTPGSGFPTFLTYQVLRIKTGETTSTVLSTELPEVHSYTDTTATSGTYHYSIYAYNGSTLVGISNEVEYIVP
jgi:hypothetical protein